MPKSYENPRFAYRRAAGFYEHADLLDELYEVSSSGLSALNVRTVRAVARRLGITTSVHVASELDALPEQADERLIELCRRMGADRYLAGAGGQDYMDLSRWRRAGIRVEFQQFDHPVYTQLHGPFVPYLSAVDLMFNAGADGLAVLRRSRKEAA